MMRTRERRLGLVRVFLYFLARLGSRLGPYPLLPGYNYEAHTFG